MSLHTYILTANRPAILARCLDRALSTGDVGGGVSVIDDSSGADYLNNSALIKKYNRAAQVRHVRAHHELSRVRRAARPAATWIGRTADYDIAPLRSLALLLAMTRPKDAALFIDDDVTDFDLRDVASTLNTLFPAPAPFVAGARIAGIDENDSLTRLHYALDRLSEVRGRDGADVRRLVSRDQVERAELPGHVSGGFMAFRLGESRAIPFPHGYNEDWLWCVLQATLFATPVIELPMQVKHAPPNIRAADDERLSFELFGDFILDMLRKMLPTARPLRHVNDLPRGRRDVAEECTPLRRVAEIRSRLSNWPEGQKSEARRLARRLCPGLSALGADRFANVDWLQVYDRWRRRYIAAATTFSRTLQSSWPSAGTAERD